MTVRAQKTEPRTVALAVGSIVATVVVAILFIGLAMRGHSCVNEPQTTTYNGTTRTVHQVVCS